MSLAPAPLIGDVGESSALRLLFLNSPLLVGEVASGLVALLVGVGLLARLPDGDVPRLPGILLFGTFGLVARFATSECPPRLGEAAGELARELVVV